MAKILCLETATTHCSVALSENGSVLASREDKSSDYSHAELLHGFIETVLQESKTTKQEISAIAVSKGPGSYTGLRIGVSTAKGLCFALDVPLIAIPTLQLLALQISSETDYIVPMLDARRMEVYASVYTRNLLEVRETRAEILHESSFSNFLEKGRVTFIGNGATKYKNICHHPKAYFEEGVFPSALDIGPIAYKKYEKEDFENVAYFEPYYLKDFIT